jgi:hypothetical protein
MQSLHGVNEVEEKPKPTKEKKQKLIIKKEVEARNIMEIEARKQEWLSQLLTFQKYQFDRSNKGNLGKKTH